MKSKNKIEREKTMRQLKKKMVEILPTLQRWWQVLQESDSHFAGHMIVVQTRVSSH